MRSMVFSCVLGLFTLLAAASRSLAAEGVLFLETFEASPLLAFPPAWHIRGDPAAARLVYQVREESGNRFLHAATDQYAIQVGLAQGFSPTEFPWLRWQWRVAQLPAGANEAQPATHDSAAGVYVLFGPWFWPRVLKYVWSTTLPVGTRIANPLYGRGKIVVVESGASFLGQWRQETVNIVEDYQALFGQLPGPALGIGLASSASFTRTRAEADYDTFVVLTTAALRAEQTPSPGRESGSGRHLER